MSAHNNCNKINGFILRNFGFKLSIIQEHIGHVELRFINNIKNVFLRPGMRISYTVIMRYGNHVIQDIVIEEMPLLHINDDIYFLHFIVEMCYYYIPVGMIEDKIYQYLMDIFMHMSLCKQKKNKNFLLCKLLSIVQLYPQDISFYPCIKFVTTMPVDKIIYENVDLSMTSKAQEWMLWSIEIHPQKKLFKAMPMLLMMDLYE